MLDADCDRLNAGKPNNLDRYNSIYQRRVAELTMKVATPSPDCAVVTQRQRVISTGRNRRHATQASYLRRSRSIGHRAIAQLSAPVASPGPNSSVIFQRQRKADRSERVDAAGKDIAFS